MHGKLFPVAFKKINAFYREFFGTVVEPTPNCCCSRDRLVSLGETFYHDVTLISNFLESA